MKKAVTLKVLREILGSLGYAFGETPEGFLVFRHPERRLFIVLPQTPDDADLRPIDLFSVRLALTGEGVVRDEDFEGLFSIRKGDRLILTDPESGAEVRATAAAGESDGIVVVERRGSLAAFPVDRVRKESLVPAGA